MTTASTYLSCISFQTTFLTVFYEIDYELAKNIQISQPFFFIVIVLCWIFISPYVKSDGLVLILSSALMTLNLLKTYIFRDPSVTLAFIHVILHGICGALYQSVLYNGVSKHLPAKYEGIGIAMVSLMNNVMNCICPIVNGYLIGPNMTKETSLNAILF